LPTILTGIQNTQKYYAVFKSNGKTKWIPLETTDRELAGRRVSEEVAKYKRTDPDAREIALDQLLTMYEQSIQGLANHTQETRKSILKVFKSTWKHGLEMRVRDVNQGQLRIWLSEQRARLKNSSFNEYVRFLRHLFALALEHKIIGHLPTEGFKLAKVEQPIRTSPTWDQFLAIVTDIRNQKSNADARNQLRPREQIQHRRC